eukprot:3356786-Amphidinium_carterae.1
MRMTHPPRKAGFRMLGRLFRNRHVTRNSMRMTHPPRRAGFRLEHHEAGSWSVYRSWLVVCVLTSVWAQEKPALH